MKLKYHVAVVAALFGLLGAAGPGAAVTPQVIRLTSVKVSQHQTKTVSVDRDNDYIGSKKIGHDTVTCSAVSKNSARCKVAFVRARGTIFLSFRTTFTALSGSGIVTGGSGAYDGVRGTFSYRALNKRNTRTAVVLRLT